MSELRTIARHASTVLVGQLAVMAFGVTDTIVAGRYSEHALAALSVGAAVYVTVFVALIGVLQALLPTWAELHGAQKRHELGKSVRQSLYLAGIGTVVGTTALLFPGTLLHWTEVPATLEGDVLRYLGVLTFALPASLLFRLYGTLNQSLGHPRIVTVLQALSLVIKVPLTIWFCFGGLGLPEMGAVGCAWATVAVQWLMVAVSMWLVKTQDFYKPYAIWQRLERPHWPTIGAFARLGVPGGLAVMVEVTSFTLMALFIARQGAVASAAHQVTANVAAVMYMVPLSLSIATSARVSYWLGAGDPKLARRAIRTGFKIALGMALAMASAVFLARGWIASAYSPNPEVVRIASGLFAVLALFHLGDSSQAMCVFVLRCYRVVIAPLVTYCVLLWGVGLAGGYALAYLGLGPFAAQNSPAAFWVAAALALLMVPPILAAILWRAVRSYPG
ncbi:MATE family efflux transporter [Ramlibacter sp. PS4R-6]|uniref:MATE family efflux transporter n=1 Tax=Ramlibacter sp. PS4R-6 TaxID=3133438 RepID=UPI0030AC0311